jgi:hypothetical protein
MITFKIATLTAMLASATLLSFAQSKEIRQTLTSTPKISLDEQPVSLNNVAADAFIAFVVADEKDYMKDLKSHFKSVHMAETRRDGQNQTTNLMVLPAWSTDSVRVTFSVEPDAQGARLSLWVWMPIDQAYVSTAKKPELAAKVKSEISAQIKSFYVKYYDSAIGDAQKEYDTQQKDVERLLKNKEKLNGEITGHLNGIRKADESITGLTTKLEKNEAVLKSLQAKKEQAANESAQLQKEMDANTIALRSKQNEYDAFNRTGDLNSKPAVRATKDLEKLNKNDAKLKEKLAKKKADATKVENAALKAESAKVDVQGKMDQNKVKVDEHNRIIENLRRELDDVERNIKDEESQARLALEQLDRLKMAKTALAGS